MIVDGTGVGTEMMIVVVTMMMIMIDDNNGICF